MKKILVRTDSSVTIGSGHLMRCLTLAEELKKNQVHVEFICRELPGNLIELVRESDFDIAVLPYTDETYCMKEETGYEKWLGVDWQTDAEETIGILKNKNADWLIIDHYAIDIKWEKAVRPYVKKIMVIDDLANRHHDCDILLDQNLVEDMETRYDGLVPSYCKKLLGPQYALLRPEFKKARENLRERDGKIRRILVFFGGSDPTNETEKAINAVIMLDRPDITVDVVVGQANPNKEKIKKLCDQYPYINYHCQVNNMAELMAKADLAIGAGGVTTWERCCLGLPAFLIEVADNQKDIIKKVVAGELSFYLGEKSKLKVEMIRKNLENVICKPHILSAMSSKVLRLVDGLGVSRVVSNLL